MNKVGEIEIVNPYCSHAERDEADMKLRIDPTDEDALNEAVIQRVVADLTYKMKVYTFMFAFMGTVAYSIIAVPMLLIPWLIMGFLLHYCMSGPWLKIHVERNRVGH